MYVIKSLPKSIHVAISGGIDSMVTLSFLSKKHDVTAIHYVHSESYTSEAESNFCSEFCSDHNIPIIIESQSSHRPPNTSKEEHWRNSRYEFFKSINNCVVTGHTLDDAVEWYLFSAFHGLGKIMDYQHANVVRPFLTTTKQQFVNYASKYQIDYIQDVSNFDSSFAMRNRIRNEILPEVLKVNPGLYTVIKKKIEKRVHP